MPTELLTPQIREKVIRAVQDWLRKHPGLVDPYSKEFIDWVESLIRYHQRYLLDPTSKPPVLGGIGYAEEFRDFFANSIFLESGYVEVSILPVDIDDPGALYYSADLVTDYANRRTADPWLGWYNVSNHLFDTGYYAAGVDSQAFKQGERRQGDPSTATDGFATGLYGTQTGKLLKLWQCQAGSEREYTELAQTIHGPDDETLSYALYTATDGNYHLIKIESTSISYAPLTYTAEGDELLVEYLSDLVAVEDITGDKRTDRTSEAHAEYRKKEAYVLAAADGIGSWTSFDSFPAIDGTPLAYGWKSNWDGSELQIVTQEATQTEPAPGVFRYEYWTGRRYKIVVTEASGVPDSITLTTEESVQWTPDTNEDVVWQPQLIVGSWVTGYWYSETCDVIPASTRKNADAPIYFMCYDEDGDPVQVRHYRQTSTTKTTSDLHAERSAFFSYLTGFYACGFGTKEGTYEGFTNGVTKGFYISGSALMDDSGQADLTEEVGDYSVYEYRKINSAHDGGISAARCLSTPSSACSCDYSSPPADHGGCGFLYNVERRRGRAYCLQDFSEGGSSGNPASEISSVLIIPLYDGESAYIHKQVRRLRNNYAYRTWQTALADCYIEWYFCNSAGTRISDVYNSKVYHDQSTPATNAAVTCFTTRNYALTSETLGTRYKATVYTVLATPHGDEIVDTEQSWEESTSNVYLNFGDYQLLVEPNQCGGSPDIIFAEGGPYVSQVSQGGQYLCRGSLLAGGTAVITSDDPGDVSSANYRQGLWIGRA